MGDVIDRLVKDVEATVKETCAKIAEAHALRKTENEFQKGYNHAVGDIAAKIRSLS